MCSRCHVLYRLESVHHIASFTSFGIPVCHWHAVRLMSACLCLSDIFTLWCCSGVSHCCLLSSSSLCTWLDFHCGRTCRFRQLIQLRCVLCILSPGILASHKYPLQRSSMLVTSNCSKALMQNWKYKCAYRTGTALCEQRQQIKWSTV